MATWTTQPPNRAGFYRARRSGGDDEVLAICHGDGTWYFVDESIEDGERLTTEGRMVLDGWEVRAEPIEVKRGEWTKTAPPFDAAGFYWFRQRVFDDKLDDFADEWETMVVEVDDAQMMRRIDCDPVVDGGWLKISQEVEWEFWSVRLEEPR
jgi:hypothetical protein